MIVATQNIYYQNRMFKANEPLPCYDAKMVEAWLKSGSAINTDKGVAKTTPIVSVKKEEPQKEVKQKEVKQKEVKQEEVKQEIKEETKTIKKVAKIKTRSKK